MVHTETGLEDLVEPICVDLADKVVLVALNVARGDEVCDAAIGVLAYDVLSVLSGVHDVVDALLDLIHTDVAGIVDLHGLVLRAALRGDDDDAVCSTGAVDGGCGGVLEYLDGLDVVRREVADGGTHRDTVDDVERRGAAERAETTDLDGRVGTWLTVGRNLDTSRLALEHGGDVGVGDLLEFIGVDDGDGTCEVGLALDTVADDDELTKLGRLLGEGEVDRGAAVDVGLRAIVSYKGDREVGVGGRHERVVAVDVGDGAICRAGLEDSGSHDGLAVIVYDAAADGHVASLRRLSRSLSLRQHECRGCESEEAR